MFSAIKLVSRCRLDKFGLVDSTLRLTCYGAGFQLQTEDFEALIGDPPLRQIGCLFLALLLLLRLLDLFSFSHFHLVTLLFSLGLSLLFGKLFFRFGLAVVHRVGLGGFLSFPLLLLGLFLLDGSLYSQTV